MHPSDSTHLFDNPDVTCQQVIDFLLLYVDGSVSPRDKAAFEDHLAQCPSCVAYLDGYRKMIAMSRASADDAPVQAGEDLPSQILRAVSKTLRDENQGPQ